MTEKAARTAHTEYTTEIPCITELYNRFGKTRASKMLGLTDIGHLIRAGKARPAYEIAAKAILEAEVPKDDKRVRSFVVKMSPEHLKILQPLIDTLGVPYLELDF
jgi:hypothetical protein